MISLVLDASTYRGTVAVLDDNRLIVEGSAAMRGRDIERLMPAVHQALTDARCGVSAVGRVICGAGPGSFTSLRIAASIAKGIAVGRNVPLFAVSSLALIVAANVKDGPRGPRRYLAVLDAMRGESYVQEYEHDAGRIRFVREHGRKATAEIGALAETLSARAVGPDQPDPWLPHARGAALLTDSDLASPVDIAAWEPVYGRLAEAQVRWEAAQKSAGA
jgi:tRNA threonylcarbamoyladenosine biosynthesis protein TsaB